MQVRVRVRINQLHPVPPDLVVRTVSERRRQEIAEKRARLAALKAAREQREAAAARSAAPSSPATEPYTSAAPSPAPDASFARPQSSLGVSTASRRSDEIEHLLRGVGVGVGLVGRERVASSDSNSNSPSRAPEAARVQEEGAGDSGRRGGGDVRTEATNEPGDGTTRDEAPPAQPEDTEGAARAQSE